jgi:hypothetical protein
MLAGLALLFCFILFFRVLTAWAEHLEMSSSWLIVGLACLAAVVAGLESYIHLIW